MYVGIATIIIITITATITILITAITTRIATPRNCNTWELLLGTPRNQAPRNHFLAWTFELPGCHCTDAFGGN